MNDLSKVDVRLGELEQITQWAIRGAHASGYPIEQSDPDFGTSPHWGECKRPAWSNCMMYRLKPKPVRETHAFKQWCVSYGGNLGPSLNASIVDVDVIQTEGTTTIETLDGKAVRIVWEAAT